MICAERPTRRANRKEKADLRVNSARDREIHSRFLCVSLFTRVRVFRMSPRQVHLEGDTSGLSVVARSIQKLQAVSALPKRSVTLRNVTEQSKATRLSAIFRARGT